MRLGVLKYPAAHKTDALAGRLAYAPFTHADALTYIWTAIFPNINSVNVVFLIKYQQSWAVRKFSVASVEVSVDCQSEEWRQGRGTQHHIKPSMMERVLPCFTISDELTAAMRSCTAENLKIKTLNVFIYWYMDKWMETDGI